MSENIYKKFRGVELIANRNAISKRFDEPSYLSFRLQFAPEMDNVYNKTSNANYDVMPHPLFDIRDYKDVNATGYVGNQEYIPEIGAYSAYQYLVDSNEPTRAAMLLDFINKFNVLQAEFPYYFQSIEGIGELLKIDSTKGQRIPNNTKLTITCLEGLDLRISYLLNLYHKIAWDDTYQRWILPDMMRYFTLKIFVSEFRTFHLPSFTETPSMNASGERIVQPLQSKTLSSNPPEKPSSKDIPLYLTILDDILPTWEINCEMCEFDLSSISFDYLSGLNIAEPIQAVVKFSVTVGNVKELQTYPAFAHTYLSDRKLNGPNRSQDEISTYKDTNNKYLYPASLHIAQNRQGPTDQNYHISGTPYNELQNDPNILNILTQPKASENLSKSLSADSTNPETWVGNAIKWGKGFAKSTINEVVDKAKITSIPKLGLSFNEIKTALQSKNVIAAFGMIRKGINEVVTSYDNAPSSLLDQPIQTDSIMKSFLTSLTLSDATDEETIELKKGANMALNDKGAWTQIKDYSLATNLLGKGEVNTVTSIESVNDGFIQPKVNAVSGNINASMTIPLPSDMLSGKITNNMSDIGKPSDKLTNLEVIEYSPTSIMSKATNSKIEQ